MLDFDKIKTDFETARNEKILGPASFTADVFAENKLVILIDIVGFSKGSTREQVYKIYAFEHYVLKQVLSNFLDFNKHIKINDFIPTGDGCYIVADECSPEHALNFLVTLVKGFQYLNEDAEHPWALRASALVGECVPILDLAHHKNYIGDGMNEAARILSYGQAALEKAYLNKNPEKTVTDAKLFSRNSLYVGDSLSSALSEYSDEGKNIVHFSGIPDKHGIKRNISVLQGLK